MIFLVVKKKLKKKKRKKNKKKQEDAKKKQELEGKKSEKKEKKVIEKSSILLDIKVWSSATDMKKLEKKIRAVQLPSLKWNASQFLDVAYGVKKLQILCTIEDEKVTGQDLEDALFGIQKDEEDLKMEKEQQEKDGEVVEAQDEEEALQMKRLVQSYEIVSWNKCG